MKKLIIIFLILIGGLLNGCVKKLPDVNDPELKFAEDKIYITEGETYQLNPVNELDVVYQIKDESYATINSDGLILALQKGETEILATYKTQKVTIILVISSIASRNLSVYYIDVGQGDSIFIQLPNGENLMIDAGYGTGYKDIAWNNITSTLDNLQIDTIHHLIITHNHSDHYAFIPDILGRYQVENVYGSGSKRTNTQYLQVMQSIKSAGLDYLVVEVGDMLIDEENLKLQVVATLKLENDDDPNITSVMTRLVYKDTAFMFTGDGGYKTSKDAEYTALHSNLDLKSDVLKVGHHGSRYSSGPTFLAAVKPKYAIMTTSTNTTDNLPTTDAINRILAVGAIIYQTKIHGTITVVSDGTNINITTEK